jgi:hypothetical protein
MTDTLTTTTLLRLSDQMIAQGADPLLLRALIEEASDLGAARALERIGLSDVSAGKDIRDVRALLDGWRAAKSSLLRMMLGWFLKMLIAGCFLALVLELKLISWR